jgi:hypothetical protein
MTRLVGVFAAALGLAAVLGCGGPGIPDGAKPEGLSADEMKKGATPAPQGGMTADQMKKGNNPRR